MRPGHTVGARSMHVLNRERNLAYEILRFNLIRHGSAPRTEVIVEYISAFFEPVKRISYFSF